MPCPSQFTLCHEKWAHMTPTERGRLCARCNKELIDFTGMSEAEIHAYHSRNPGTCGFYSLSQFHKPAWRLTAAAAAAAIGLTVPTLAHAALQAPASGITQSAIEPADSVVVKGIVVDSATNQPIAGAQVVIIGTTLGSITDYNGQFRFIVRNPITLPIRLKAQRIGYRDKETSVTVTDSLANLKFVLSQTFVGIVGIVVVGEPQRIVPKEKPSFWRRLWRALGGK
jgi:hypothetical protein